MSEFKVKLADDNPPVTEETKSQEEAVLESAVESGDVAPEAAGIEPEDGVYKVNLDKPTEDAVQEQETTSVDVGEQTRDGEGVDRQVREEPSQEDAGTESDSTEPESPIEYVQDETSNVESSNGDDVEPADNTKSEEADQVDLPELPEGVDKLVTFMKETGGDLEDYINLNRDIDQMAPLDILKEHYKKQNPGLEEDEINFIMEEEFLYDKDIDSEREIKKKQIAFKKAVGEAKHSIKNIRDKYYEDLKFSRSPKLSQEQKDAIQAYEKQQEATKLAQTRAENFKKKTNDYFNDFKGFEFKIGDNKVRYKVTDVEKTKEFQSSIENWLGEHVENDQIKDAGAFHKQLYAARNIDKIAQHFYDQGRADAVKQTAKESKNIDMGTRKDASSIVTSGGQKIKVVSGDDSGKLRFRMGKYK